MATACWLPAWTPTCACWTASLESCWLHIEVRTHAADTTQDRAIIGQLTHHGCGTGHKHESAKMDCAFTPSDAYTIGSSEDGERGSCPLLLFKLAAEDAPR